MNISYAGSRVNLPAVALFWSIFLTNNFGLVFWLYYLYWACFQILLACFCKITWHHLHLEFSLVQRNTTIQ